MTDKKKIRKEVERLFKENRERCSREGYAAVEQLRKVLAFIDSLQEEPESEDLANAAIEYCGGDKGSDARVRAAFVVGANWQKEQIMKNDFSMEVFYETEWDDIHKFLRKNLNGEKVKLVIIKE